MKCRCGHDKADHVRGGGCRAIKRDIVFVDGICHGKLVECACDQYDARKVPLTRSLVRGGINPGGLEDDYK